MITGEVPRNKRARGPDEKGGGRVGPAGNKIPRRPPKLQITATARAPLKVTREQWACSTA